MDFDHFHETDIPRAKEMQVREFELSEKLFGVLTSNQDEVENLENNPKQLLTCEYHPIILVI